MLIPSRSWGFIRSGLNGHLGVTVANLGTGGTEDNPILNDVEPGDEAAGVEFCLVFSTAPTYGTFTHKTNGATSWLDLPDGTHTITGSLITFTPGDSGIVYEGDEDIVVIIGASTITLTGIDSTQNNSSNSVSINQVHILNGINSDQQNTSTTGNISGTIILIGIDSNQLNSSSTAAINQIIELISNNSVQINSNSTESITQVHILNGINSVQINFSSSSSLLSDIIILIGKYIQNSNNDKYIVEEINYRFVREN